MILQFMFAILNGTYFCVWGHFINLLLDILVGTFILSLYLYTMGTKKGTNAIASIYTK